jgi:hypothetical protein
MSSDWIEIYNAGPGSADLGGCYLTDDLQDPTKFRIAEGTSVPAGDFLVFYADGNPELGPHHTNFRLNKNGGEIGLFGIDAAGNQPIDLYTFGPQAAGKSEGRCPDGSDTWASLTPATPSEPNTPCSSKPVISKANRDPVVPLSTDNTSITAIIVDDSALVTATLWYSAGGSYRSIPMVPLDADVYAATIPAQPDGTVVAYYIQTEDDQGVSVTDPVGAPVEVYQYSVGYQKPRLLINEFMAENTSTLEDPDEPGEFPDWIELFNSGAVPVDVGGKYLTDDLTDPTKFRIPNGLIIPSGGFIVFYADDDAEQGPLHTTFRLSKNGEEIGLFDSDATGNQPIDTHTYGWQGADLSERRYPDGEPVWVLSHTPTPGGPNAAAERSR